MTIFRAISQFHRIMNIFTYFSYIDSTTKVNRTSLTSLKTSSKIFAGQAHLHRLQHHPYLHLPLFPLHLHLVIFPYPRVSLSCHHLLRLLPDWTVSGFKFYNLEKPLIDMFTHFWRVLSIYETYFRIQMFYFRFFTVFQLLLKYSIRLSHNFKML